MRKTDQPRCDGEARHEIGEPIRKGPLRQDYRWLPCLGKNLLVKSLSSQDFRVLAVRDGIADGPLDEFCGLIADQEVVSSLHMLCDRCIHIVARHDGNTLHLSPGH